MYLALSEHTAPLGGIHDVFIKDAISEYSSSCEGRIRCDFHKHTTVLLDTFWNSVSDHWATGQHRVTTWALA